MDKLIQSLRKKPHIALSVPTLLCAITFVTNLVQALSDGVITDGEYHRLLTTANGFETTVLFILMLVLKDKK